RRGGGTPGEVTSRCAPSGASYGGGGGLKVLLGGGGGGGEKIFPGVGPPSFPYSGRGGGGGGGGGGWGEQQRASDAGRSRGGVPAPEQHAARRGVGIRTAAHAPQRPGGGRARPEAARAVRLRGRAGGLGVRLAAQASGLR